MSSTDIEGSSFEIGVGPYQIDHKGLNYLHAAYLHLPVHPLTRRCGSKALVGKCGGCSKSQAKKDAERRVAEAEAMGQEDT